MIRATPIFVIACLSFCAVTTAQDDFGDFTFPEIGSEVEYNQTAPVVPKVETKKSPTSPLASISTPMQSQSTSAERPTAITKHNCYPDHNALDAPMYFTSGPSNPSPLLSYMQCSADSCGNVWAGFAAQHQADMACFCNGHSNCGCGHCGQGLRTMHYDQACQSCGPTKPLVNRYNRQSICATCDSQ